MSPSCRKLHPSYASPTVTPLGNLTVQIYTFFCFQSTRLYNSVTVTWVCTGAPISLYPVRPKHAELVMSITTAVIQGSHSFGSKKIRSFPVQFQNIPGAFGHSSQPNIKHIWTAIVTKRLPNIIECNQCQYLL